MRVQAPGFTVFKASNPTHQFARSGSGCGGNAFPLLGAPPACRALHSGRQTSRLNVSRALRHNAIALLNAGK